MTLRTLIVALRRHWPVTLLMVLLAIPVLAAIVTAPPTYTSRATVYFIQAPSSREPNVLGTTRSSVISTAGVVQRAIQGRTTTHVISDNLSLTDMGVQEGTSIRLPNSGGQWANNFETPALIVETVGQDPNQVQAKLTETLDAISGSLADMQRDAGAEPTTWITTKTEPSDLSVVAVSGSGKRALLYLSLLVVGVIASVVVHLETRRARHQAPPLPQIAHRQAEIHA